ncbi:hypothetical protein FAM09_10265 [Niastella caeni]|uniref:Uncharacterized protein n=1 Tax=Niastella caeni TaxID=2569763 RepID=A0A4S8HX10_9BACT|nr:hypothetical protein [Niastella caeni]THU40243.1 hypothetical protein FAM09_10265 [Niastella caeni]
MNYYPLIWLLFAAILIITFFKIDKKRNKKNSFTFVAFLIMVASLAFLPRQIFGRWNSISELDGKVISEIRLQPSEPDWKVNLVGRDFIITDKKQIDTITQLLRKVEVYSPSHPPRIWETNMVFITTSKDTFKIEVFKSNEYNGTVINALSRWRKDEIGSFLEKVTKYRQPVYSDTTTMKFE